MLLQLAFATESVDGQVMHILVVEEVGKTEGNKTHFICFDPLEGMGGIFFFFLRACICPVMALVIE